MTDRLICVNCGSTTAECWARIETGPPGPPNRTCCARCRHQTFTGAVEDTVPTCAHCMQDAVEPARMINWSGGTEFYLCHPGCYLLVLVGRHAMPCADCATGGI